MSRRTLTITTILLLFICVLVDSTLVHAYPLQLASHSDMQPASTPLGYVRTAFLNIRQFPNPYATIVGRLARGEQVFVQGTIRSRRWVRVVASNGRAGWVNAYYLRLTTPAYLLPFVE